MQLTEFYNCALRAPREPIVLDTGAQRVVVRANAFNDPDANAHAREALAKTLEEKINAGTAGLDQALQDLRINNRNEPLTGEIVNGYRLKFRNTEGFKAVSGVPVENDHYFSHEERYRRAKLRLIRKKGSSGDKVLRWKHWLNVDKVRILQREVENTEEKSYSSYGENQETKRLRSTLKSYEKSWKALCRGKRSRFTRKKEWVPLYQDGTLVKDGKLRNLAVYVLARKLSAECKLLSAAEQTGTGGQRAQEELRRKINDDYTNLRSIIDACKTDAQGNDLSSAISLRTLDVAATAIDLHAMATNETVIDANGAGRGGEQFCALLADVHRATNGANARRAVRSLDTLANNPERTGRRSWFQQRHDNVSLRRELRQACENSGFFDKNFVTQFWAGHHKELLGKDTSNLTASQIKEFTDALGKEAASKGKLLNIESLYRDMVVDHNAAVILEPVAIKRGPYEDIAQISLPKGHTGVYKLLETISADTGYLEQNPLTSNFSMKALGVRVPIKNSDINEIEARLTRQYVAEHGLVALGNEEKEDVHKSVVDNPLLMVTCFEYLEEKHERSCEEALLEHLNNKHEDSQAGLVGDFGWGNPAGDAELLTLLEGKDGIDLGLEKRLRNNYMEGFREAYKESDDPLSEFRDMETLGEKMRTNLPNLKNAEYLQGGKTENQVTAYKALFCSDIPEQVFENAKNNLPRMRGALRVLEDPEMGVKDRLSALARVEIVFNEVENAKAERTGFLERPGTSMDYEPLSAQRLTTLGKARDDFDTRHVVVDKDLSEEGRRKKRLAEDESLFAPDESLFTPDERPFASSEKLFVRSGSYGSDSDSEEIVRNYEPTPFANAEKTAPSSRKTGRGNFAYPTNEGLDSRSASPGIDHNPEVSERTTTESPIEPKAKPAKLQGDALKMRLMTVFSDLSRIMDDTHLFVGERRVRVAIPPPTDPGLPTKADRLVTPDLLDSAEVSVPDVSDEQSLVRQQSPTETESPEPPDTPIQEAEYSDAEADPPADQVHFQPDFRDPAMRMEDANEIGIAWPRTRIKMPKPAATRPTVPAKKKPTDIVQNNFQEEVHAIRAIVHARNRAIRMQRELAHRRKIPLDQKQLYVIHGADGQPVDTGWLNKLAGLVHVGQVVSSVNGAPPQLTGAFIHPLSMARQNIEPRNLASRDNLAGQLRTSTFDNLIQYEPE